MTIYIPCTVGVADEDKPYVEWMEALIHAFLTARPMRQRVYKQPQTPGQILATTYLGLYSTPKNKEIHDLIILSEHELYVMYVAEMTTRTHLLSQTLGLYQLPAPLEE